MNLLKSVVSILLLCLSSSIAFAQDKPNIVLVFMDNFGWGEPGFNGGGIVRGAETRSTGCGGIATYELQCGSPVHAVAFRDHDGTLRNP